MLVFTEVNLTARCSGSIVATDRCREHVQAASGSIYSGLCIRIPRTPLRVISLNGTKTIFLRAGQSRPAESYTRSNERRPAEEAADFVPYGAGIAETVNGVSGSAPPTGPPSSNCEFTTNRRLPTSAPVVGKSPSFSGGGASTEVFPSTSPELKLFLRAILVTNPWLLMT